MSPTQSILGRIGRKFSWGRLRRQQTARELVEQIQAIDSRLIELEKWRAGFTRYERFSARPHKFLFQTGYQPCGPKLAGMPEK